MITEVTAIKKKTTTIVQSDKPLLFVVWIDTNLVSEESGTDWEMNSPPQALERALDEAARLRTEQWPCVILIEGQTPRPDGLFSNPSTDSLD